MSASMNTSADQSGASSAGGKKYALHTANNLNYILQPDLSIVVNSTYKTHQFAQQEYKDGSRAICILNSGADYIDTRRSYLSFKIRNNSETKMNLTETHTGLDFIQQVIVSSRSGDELVRINEFNKLAAAVYPYKYGKNWYGTVGEMIGTTIEKIEPAAYYHYVIPMYLLSDLFAYGKLLPSMLMSGLRIELVFDTAAGVTADSDGASYVAYDTFFSLRSCQLTDATQRSLNELSAVNGLEIVYSDWETTTVTNQSTAVYTEVRRACSRALKAFAVFRPTANRASLNDLGDGVYRDKFITGTYAIKQYQWQLGSLYFPQQPIKAPATNLVAEVAVIGSKEAYYMTLDACDKTGGTNQHDTAYASWSDFYSKNGTLAVNLERSELFKLSGIPINNSRVLSLHATLQGDDDGATTIIEAGLPTSELAIYLKYVKLARIFLNNVEVEQ